VPQNNIPSTSLPAIDKTWREKVKTDVIVGLAVIAGSLGAIIFLTLWCRRIIENLHSKRSKQPQKISEETGNEGS